MAATPTPTRTGALFGMVLTQRSADLGKHLGGMADGALIRDAYIAHTKTTGLEWHAAAMLLIGTRQQ